MPHADSSLIPDDITTKQAFYDHVYDNVCALIEGTPFWVSNLANASSLLYHSYLGCKALYGEREDGEPVVNWAGFYIHPPESSATTPSPLLLGPFCGRPACQIIQTQAGKGVCADSFVGEKTLVVVDVHAYPGHIACDDLSQSEIVIPLRSKSGKVIGVMDLDSTVKGTFDEIDRAGLERIAEVLRI